ncbi:helix-turn-helix transcriptional regulator [Pectobacterium cacticida]|uniref:helix-turn-helix domain-containing protein n=1 Tax=Pectobacterium cacticida TaxID=69221 RepID=UPI002FF162FD
MLRNMKTIGSKCQQKRKTRGWTQQEAAKRAGIHRTVISEIENGHYTGSLKSLIAYTTVLGLELSVQTANVPQLDNLEELFNDD